MPLRVISWTIRMAETWHGVCYREGQEERNMAHEAQNTPARLYDTLTIPCNSDGAPLNLAAEREHITQEELHARVMAPLAPGYRRSVVHTCSDQRAIWVMTYDEAGGLYELLIIGRA
jgi:hypothetical protein